MKEKLVHKDLHTQQDKVATGHNRPKHTLKASGRWQEKGEQLSQYNHKV